MESIVFKTKVKDGRIELPDAKSFAGKEVKVTVEEVAAEKKGGSREWKSLGSVHINQNIDDINLRDFAYE